MEVYSFETNDVEKLLDDISSSLNILSLAVNGLRNNNSIKENEVRGFEFLLDDASSRADALIKGMKPVWLGKSDRSPVLFGYED